MATKHSIRERIRWLVQNYQHKKPVHRDVLDVVDSQGARVSFQAGKLLQAITGCFLPDAAGGVQAMNPDDRRALLQLWWFQDWIDQLDAKRRTNATECAPSLEEQTKLLILNYPDTAPKKGQAVTVERLSGTEYELNGYGVLEKIAGNFHGDDCHELSKGAINVQLQCQLLALKWAADWVLAGRKRREVARLRTVVTKAMKLEFLLHYFKHEKPAWKSRVPIRIPDLEGAIFQFYPGTWIDDIADNWLHASRPNVVLSSAQKMAIETLPWFSGWMQAVELHRDTRKDAKRARRVSNETDVSVDADDGEENLPFLPLSGKVINRCDSEGERMAMSPTAAINVT